MAIHRCEGVDKKRMIETLEAQRATMLELEGTTEFTDFGDLGHLSRVQGICWILAYHARTTTYSKDISCDDAIDIALASALHDIGKVGIPLEILDKPGKLSTDEFEVMKKHVTIGVATINEISAKNQKCSYFDTARDITAYHHEKWDGKGYPYGLSGEDIPVSARICAIADVYDALREKRSYKRAFTHNEAIKIIKEESGTHFDPSLTKVFIEHSKEMEVSFKNKEEIDLMEVIVSK